MILSLNSRSNRIIHSGNNERKPRHVGHQASHQKFRIAQEGKRRLEEAKEERRRQRTGGGRITGREGDRSGPQLVFGPGQPRVLEISEAVGHLIVNIELVVTALGCTRDKSTALPLQPSLSSVAIRNGTRRGKRSRD